MSAPKIWFDRNLRSIYGFLTYQHVDGTRPIVRARAASGQKGYTATSWHRGKSPIPFGTYTLVLEPIGVGLKPGRTGIGEAWPICSDPKNIDLITNDKGQVRELIRLHAENAFPGSAGCIVLDETVFDQLRVYFFKLIKFGIREIELEVL